MNNRNAANTLYSKSYRGLFCFWGVLLLLPWSRAFATLDIDIPVFLQACEQEKDVRSCLLLSRYYFNRKDYRQTRLFLNKAESIQKTAEGIASIKNDLVQLEKEKQLLQKAGIDSLDNLKVVNKQFLQVYFSGDYKLLVELFKLLERKKISLDDSNKLHIARVFFWNGQYNQSARLIAGVKDKKTLSFLSLKADLCWEQGQYSCALKYYKLLYDATGALKYGLKLAGLYRYQGEYDKAERLLLYLSRHNASSTQVKKALEEIHQVQNRLLEKLQKKYQQSHQWQDLKNYLVALFERKQNKKAFSLLKAYIQQNPYNEQALYFYGVRLSWAGKNDQAYKVLSNIKDKDNFDVQLMLGKVLSWSGKLEQAVGKLQIVIENSTNEEQILAARKALAFAYMWKGENDKARKLFAEVVKQNPKDKESKEQLMVLNGNYQTIIQKYENLLRQKKISNEQLLQLARFYQLSKKEQRAIELYELYLKSNPKSLEIARALGNLYLQKKSYYKAFGYLEFYAYKSQDAQALFSLAQNYYWAGFSDEAMEVLDDMLRKNPENRQAESLKAEILKHNPRFVSKKTASGGMRQLQNEKALKQKKIADRLYYEGFYEACLPYYRDYLTLNPEDYKTHYHYALALEWSGYHKQAAGEFFLVYWDRRDDELDYHYAFNLEKSGQQDKARKIYQKLLQKEPKKLPTFLERFIKSWESAWESQNFQHYLRFYDKKYQDNLSWRLKKERIFAQEKFIAVSVSSPYVLFEKDHYKVQFYQEYAASSHRDRGYKTLTVFCNQKKADSCVIAGEHWEKADFKPKDLTLFANINKRLQGLNTTKKKQHTIDYQQFHQVKEIVLNDGAHKDLQKESEALGYRVLHTTSLDEKQIYRNRVKYFKQLEKQGDLPKRHTVGVTGLFFEDKYGAVFERQGLFYQYQSWHKNQYRVVFSTFNVRNSKVTEAGSSAFISIKREAYTLGGYLDQFINYSDFNPYLEWKQGSGQGDLNIRFYRRNMALYRWQPEPVAKKTSALLLEVSDRFEVAERPLSVLLTLSSVSDGNRMVNPGFDWTVVHFSSGKLSQSYHLSGWYLGNAFRSADYYSPNFYDSTAFASKLGYAVDKNTSLEARLSAGLSFSDSSLLYGAEFWYRYNPSTDNLSGKFGCLASNSKSINKTSNAYDYSQCQFNLEFYW